VDPGFGGQIFLPLHKLTCNEYILTGGEPIAWMEFTKISPNQRWLETYDPRGRCAPYVPFPDRKRELTLEKYVARASSRPIRSSISTSIEEAQRSAETAKNAVGKAQTRITVASAIAVVTVVAALVAIYLQVVSTVHDVNSENSSLTLQVSHLEREVALLNAQRRHNPATSERK
jgi:hypothetical protein